MIYSSEDRKLFTRLCSKLITDSTIEKTIFKEYKFYLVGLAAHDDLNSTIFKYQKLWKRLGRQFNLDNFTLGPEVEYSEAGNLYYGSIAEFKVDEFYHAIKIISSNPQQFAILGSKRQDYRSEKFIRTLINKVYVKGTIDYFKLSLSSCPDGDLVFRWGDSSEECELDIITLAQNKRMFYGVPFN